MTDNHVYARNPMNVQAKGGSLTSQGLATDEDFLAHLEAMARNLATPHNLKPGVLQQMQEDARTGSRLSFRKPSKPGKPGAADLELYGSGLAARTIKDELL